MVSVFQEGGWHPMSSLQRKSHGFCPRCPWSWVTFWVGSTPAQGTDFIRGIVPGRCPWYWWCQLRPMDEYVCFKQRTILIGQGHISELLAILQVSEGIVDNVSWKRRRWERKNALIMQANVFFRNWLFLRPGGSKNRSECGILTLVDKASTQQLFNNV